MMRCRVSASPASSLTIRPSAMTSTRSQRSGSSSGSEDMTRTAMPRAASVRMSRWISTRAPTSTPRVGSSRMSTFGCNSSHRPMTTFCWLPPLSWPTGVSMLEVLIARSRIVRSASALRRRPLIIGSIGLATIEARLASPTLKARLFAKISPSARRSSGTKPKPARTAWAGLRGAKRLPSSVISPRSGRSAPNRRRASSLRPAPTRPPSPSTSPFRRSKLISLTLGARPSRRTDSATSAVVAASPFF